MINRVYRRLGDEATVDLVDKVKTIGFKYATISGTTMAVSDLTIPDEREGILLEARKNVDEIDRQYRRGLLTEEEQYQRTIEQWTSAKSKVEVAVRGAIEPTGPMAVMASNCAISIAKSICYLAFMDLRCFNVVKRRLLFRSHWGRGGMSNGLMGCSKKIPSISCLITTSPPFPSANAGRSGDPAGGRLVMEPWLSGASIQSCRRMMISHTRFGSSRISSNRTVPVRWRASVRLRWD